MRLLKNSAKLMYESPLNLPILLKVLMVIRLMMSVQATKA